MRLHVVAGGNNTMDDNASLSVFSRVVPEALPQRSGAVGDEGVMLDVVRHDEPGRRFLGSLLVDQKVVHRKNIVLVAKGATITRINDFNHNEALFSYCFKRQVVEAQAEHVGTQHVSSVSSFSRAYLCLVRAQPPPEQGLEGRCGTREPRIRCVEASSRRNEQPKHLLRFQETP